MKPTTSNIIPFPANATFVRPKEEDKSPVIVHTVGRTEKEKYIIFPSYDEAYFFVNDHEKYYKVCEIQVDHMPHHPTAAAAVAVTAKKRVKAAV